MRDIAAERSTGLEVVAGAVTALAAVPAGLATTGTLGRAQRNEPELLMIAVGFALLSALVWVASSTRRAGSEEATPEKAAAPETQPAAPSEPAREKEPARGKPGGKIARFRDRWGRGLASFLDRWGRVASAGLGTAAVCLAALAAIEAASEEQKPTVSAELSADGRTLTAKVSGSNYASDDEVSVRVERISASFVATDELARATVGPDADGHVSLPLKVPVPPGRDPLVGVRAFNQDDPSPRCARAAPDERRGAGCVVIRLPPATKPHLGATWNGSGRTADSITITVRATNAVQTLLQVVAERNGRTLRLQRAVLAADADGKVDTSARIPVPSGVERVCAQAEAIADGARIASAQCPRSERVRPGAAVVELALPPP